MLGLNQDDDYLDDVEDAASATLDVCDCGGMIIVLFDDDDQPIAQVHLDQDDWNEMIVKVAAKIGARIGAAH